jgi:hypothetical protein
VHLKAGDKVCVTGVEVKEDSAKIALLTQDAFDVDVSRITRTIHFTAFLWFKYDKGYLNTVSPSDVLKLVGAIIHPQGASISDPPPAVARPCLSAHRLLHRNPSFRPLQSPLRPERPSTRSRSNSGNPQQILDRGDVKVYAYRNLKITFTKGLVTDLD